MRSILIGRQSFHCNRVQRQRRLPGALELKLLLRVPLEVSLNLNNRFEQLSVVCVCVSVHWLIPIVRISTFSTRSLFQLKFDRIHIIRDFTSIKAPALRTKSNSTDNFADRKHKIRLIEEDCKCESRVYQDLRQSSSSLS